MKLLVTGTDTDVGKTVVSTALLAAARADGRSVCGIKLGESGCELDDDGQRVPADANALARAAGHDPICPFRYRAPLAPAVAAAEADEAPLDLATLRDVVEDARADVVLAEGAGGLLVPMAPELTVADIAAALKLPILIVARDGLGTINHTALTIQSARQHGLEVLGFVFSASGDVEAPRARSNADEIIALTDAPYWGRLPRTDPADLDALASAARALDRRL